jgi:transposase
MAFIAGHSRRQSALFSTLDDLIPQDHPCRVIDAFVTRLAMDKLGFERAQPAGTGRPGYDPRDLLRLLLYGYSQQIRSSRRLEVECRRNVELMWLLGRLQPDHKTIAEFRRLHGEALRAAEAELVGFARDLGMVKGEWVAIDGSKFRAQSSYESVRQRTEWENYLAEVEAMDQQEEAEQQKRQDVEAKLAEHPEPEARFMRCAGGTNKIPGYNLQIAVDAEHAMIVVAQASTEANDSRSLQPMAEAAQARVGRSGRKLHVLADTGYSNGEQAQGCEERGIVPHVPRKYGSNAQGEGELFRIEAFRYMPRSDSYVCPAGKRLMRRQLNNDSRAVVYVGQEEVCGRCALKPQCTPAARRTLKRHLYAGALERMERRATAAAMRLRRSIVEHPFASLKYRIFGHPKLLLRGVRGAQTEFSIAVMVYNLKRMTNVLGGKLMRECLETG